jgi:hypothetical protein
MNKPRPGGQMATTKERKGRKAVPVSGLLSEVVGGGLPRDFLTWHDINPYRVWVHSRQSGSGYKPIALELQWLGEKKLLVSEEERSARLKLAVLRDGDVSISDLRPSIFRSIPVGSILEAHVSLVLSQKLSRIGKSQRQIELVKDHESETYQSFNLFLDGSNRLQKANREIGANKRDSIVIAYFYAEQCANGSKRPAALVAKLLNIEPKLVYVAVRIARRKGWLTESTSGSAGGQLTKEGQKEFARVNGNYFYEEFIKRGLKEVR